ncbi:MAG: cupin domain-containing protein [Thermodesulfobacteriota bacterium]|nr:cupin domain-containing protein [Thermodesulfobacteriota bacterium]
MKKSEYEKIVPYETKDGSLIRELMHPEVHGNSTQSLAEATVPVGSRTFLHRHRKSEEIYHITQGTGLMSLDNDTFSVRTGDTVCIQPGTSHWIKNTGDAPLRILCCCAPPYSHDDTELL